VGLVEAVAHGGVEQIAAILRERCYEERGGLNVCYGVFTGVVLREESAGFFCGEACGGQRQ
jgi:hypothetical protein